LFQKYTPYWHLIKRLIKNLQEEEVLHLPSDSDEEEDKDEEEDDEEEGQEVGINYVLYSIKIFVTRRVKLYIAF